MQCSSRCLSGETDATHACWLLMGDHSSSPDLTFVQSQALEPAISSFCALAGNSPQ